MKRLKNIRGGFFVLIFVLFVFSGCDLIESWLGLGEEEKPAPKLTITEPTDGAYLSIVGSVTFKGTYENVGAVKLKVGDTVYDKMDIMAGGKWEVTIDLSDIGFGEKEVKVLGYQGDSSTATVETDPIKITVHNYWDPKNPDDVYKWLILKDSDYEGYPAGITDVVTDDTYVYVAGYYIISSSHFKPFVYRFNPVLGTYDKKRVVDPSVDNGGGDLLPVLVAVGDGKIYLEYSAYGMNVNIEALDENLVSVYSYSDDSNSYIFRGMDYKDGYLYLAGEEYTGASDGNSDGNIDTVVLKIQDTGSAFGTPSVIVYDPDYNGSSGYDIVVADNNYVYVAASYLNSVWRAVVFAFKNDLSHYADMNDINDGAMYGICYSSKTNKLYATGVFMDAGSDASTIFVNNMNPDDVYDDWEGQSFQQSNNTGTFHDEEGHSIIYDSDTGYAIIVGFEGATDSSRTGATASICVRKNATGVKTVLFNEDGYGESCLDSVIKTGDKYFAVGYAKDANGDKCPLIMWVPNSFE